MTPDRFLSFMKVKVGGRGGRGGGRRRVVDNEDNKNFRLLARFDLAHSISRVDRSRTGIELINLTSSM